jgi:hypothetical protein
VADDHILKRDLAKTPESTALALKALWGSRQPSATAEQLGRADYYLGADYLQAPAELRKQLLWAELLDKVGIRWHNRKNVAGLVAPTYYRRTARLLKRRLQAAGHWLSRSRTRSAGAQ